MSLNYKAVGWNRQKKIYDRTLIGGVVLYLALFMGLGAVMYPDVTAEALMIRGFGTAAFLLLHIILSIGPLCRLDKRFLPLLYNRRHMGVTMFVLALAHGGFSLVQFHAVGNVNPLVSLFTSNTNFGSISEFPFQPLGFMALVILFLMAATSHDFWLANLSAPVWKSLHMGVYVAYALIVAHVSLGVLQSETSQVLSGFMVAGFICILTLHMLAASTVMKKEKELGSGGSDYVRVCSVDEIPENRAHVAVLTGERIAVFKYDGKISAISGICQHQNGPLGEGCIIDGLVTCPWHGYQYRPEDGSSPAPFDEQVPTFNVRIENGDVWVDPKPNPAGTKVTAQEISS